MFVLRTERLSLRHLSVADTPFVLKLLNDPTFIQHIGDRGLRDLEDASRYLTLGPIASYNQHGFGLYLVELDGSETAVGICGLLKRDALEYVDLGFSLLPEFRSKGYAREAAVAVLNYGWNALGLARIAAIAAPNNALSIRLLEQIGFTFDKMVQLPNAPEESKLFLTTPANAVRESSASRSVPPASSVLK